MNTKWPGIITLGIFFGITVIGFCAWIFGISVLWFSLHMLNFNADLMSMIGSLSTAVGASAVFGAGFIAYRELSEVANSRHMDIADRLFNELNSPDSIEARRMVYQNLHQDPEIGIKEISKEDRDAVKKVLNSLDRVAFLTQSGWIPDDVIMPWMHPMITKSWEKLSPYVEYERKRRNEPYYYRYAGELANRCNKWRKKNNLQSETNWLNESI